MRINPDVFSNQLGDKMTPLMLAIAIGQKDEKLLDIINDLERIKRVSKLSEVEEDTYYLAFCRLDMITEP